MSIVGHYVRLKQAELLRAAEEPGWLSEFVEELAEREAGRALTPGERRCHDTGKAWDALRFLLERRGFPVDVVHGEEELPGEGDRGYGPPRTLAPERVEQAARELAGLPFDELVTGGTAAGLDTAAALAAAGVYPVGLWADPSGLEYVSAHYAGLVGFLRVTARYRQGLVIRHG